MWSLACLCLTEHTNKRWMTELHHSPDCTLPLFQTNLTARHRCNIEYSGKCEICKRCCCSELFIILLLTSPFEWCCKYSANTLGPLNAWVPRSKVNSEFFNIFANLKRTLSSFTFKQDSDKIPSTKARKGT